MDDRELLDAFVKEHSQSAFRELVERHLPVVYSAARRMVRDSHLAEEIAQSVFTTLAQKAQTIRPPQVLGGWLYNTTRHLAMHAVRGEQRRREREQTAVAMQTFESAPDESPLAEHLEPAMAELDIEDRDALVLRFLANRGLREVGAELGVSEEAARKRVGRALEKLRGVLERRGITATSALLATALTASTIAIPNGLGATITTTALAGAAVKISAVAVATKSIAMTTLQKTLIAGALALAFTTGIGTLVFLKVRAAKTSSAQANAANAPALINEAQPAAADSVSGVLESPDGQPLVNAQIFLSTAATPVPIYAPPSPDVLSTTTDRDGRFSFPSSPENRAVIVIHDNGYGQATIAELATHSELKLQPWARVQGTLREGNVSLANQTIHLSRTRFGSKIQEQAFRTVHDVTVKTDELGHYVFHRVAPGDAWISWRKSRGNYDAQYRYFDVQPGQSLVADIGGRGRAVIGRAVLVDSATPAQFFGSVWPRTPHQMNRPPNWAQLSAEEQHALTAAWENSPDGKLFNQEKCPIDFRLAADGTFTVTDLPAGNYRIVVVQWAGGPMTSKMLARGQAMITVPEMPGGRSDEPLDIGEVRAYSVAPLREGDPAPLFEARTFDDKPLRLADYKGKYVLLNFWRTATGESLANIRDLKAAQEKWGKDKRLALIGINFDAALPEAKKYAADNGITWPQCVAAGPELMARFRRSNPDALLIGPDGLVVKPTVHASQIALVLEEVLGAK